MPTNEPSSAPQNEQPQPTDDLSAAAVLHDESLDQPAGGGGLRGADASADLGGDAAGKVGAATPNSPISTLTPHDGGEVKAAAEARARSVASAPAEPGHTSR